MAVTDQKILGYLGRCLSLELSAVQLYMTQARLVSSWGLDQVARRFRQESLEELEHAERIMARMLAMGFTPGASQLRPVKPGPDLVSLLHFNWHFEMELVQLYQEAVNYCEGLPSADDRIFFQQLLEEEQHHAAELSEWMSTLRLQQSSADNTRSTRRRYR